MNSPARRLVVGAASALAGLVALAALTLYALGAGCLGTLEGPGEVSRAEVSPAAVERRAAAQRETANALDGAGPSQKQILFGDLHVHSTFSFDAFLLGLPLLGGTGSHPPADACDFARFCSALDFWSINDHAEALTPRLWRDTVDSVRQCNAVAGDPANPDLVTYLGWEWSQMGTRPDNHYGHKNVVFRGLEDHEIPTRPIAATTPGFAVDGGPFPAGVTTTLALFSGQRGRDFARYLAAALAIEPCPTGVPVRELPTSCREYAETPEQLFAKLDDWGQPSIVIPHGTTWGVYTPAASSWDKQLAGHDPVRERLVEIYSGHGNSEEYRSWRAAAIDARGRPHCPEPTADYLPSCWRSGELIRERCLEQDEAPPECERRAVEARQNYVDAGQGGWRTAPGHGANAWLDSGQCRDCFQPAFNYRPASSTQYMMAVRNFDDPQRPERFRMGFIGSSDIHTARPGTGYKEFWRGEMTEGRGADPEQSPPSFLIPAPGEPGAESAPFDLDTSDVRAFGLFENERANAFFLTGGLVAVHSEGRDRVAIFDAMERREVYATSGPRILLWFDLETPDGGVLPMGAATRQRETPRFSVRAAGSFEQKPGCSDESTSSLGADRLQQLCRGECYHPSDQRRRIERIEIVRIRPQAHADEPLEGLIEDPWRTFACPADPTGCHAEFEDTEFSDSGRDAVYYARAIESPTLAIHGDNPLGCTYDEEGSCVAVEPCGVHVPKRDDCLRETRQRAWSSPIFVDHDGPAS